MNTLVDALRNDLSKRPNVTILKDNGIETVQRRAEGDIKASSRVIVYRLTLIVRVTPTSVIDHCRERATHLTRCFRPSPALVARHIAAVVASRVPPSVCQSLVIRDSGEFGLPADAAWPTDTPGRLRLSDPSRQGRPCRSARHCLRLMLVGRPRRVSNPRLTAIYQDDHDDPFRPHHTSHTRACGFTSQLSSQRSTSTSRTSALPCAQPSRLHSCAVGGACAADERARRCGAEGLGELADCAWCWRWWRECTRLYRAGEAGRFQLVGGLSWACSARLRDVTNLRL